MFFEQIHLKLIKMSHKFDENRKNTLVLPANSVDLSGWNDARA